AHGLAVNVLLLADPASLRGDAAVNYTVAEKSGIPIQVLTGNVSAPEIAPLLREADWIVDALLGTGAQGNPQPPMSTMIECINAAPASKLAVDLPSGLNCDTGEPATPTIRADVTCTFVACKQGFQHAVAR